MRKCCAAFSARSGRNSRRPKRAIPRVLIEIARVLAQLCVLVRHVPLLSPGTIVHEPSYFGMDQRMTTLERRPHAGCSWIVDQLIGIRDLEQQLIAALASGDQPCTQLRSRLGELDRWVDILERALDASVPAADQDRTVGRSTRCVCLSERHQPEIGRPFQRARLQRAG